MKYFMLATGAVMMLGAAGHAQEEVTVANTYLAAYEAQDFATLSTLYAPDAVFIDPTSFAVDQTPPIEWQTPETIISGIRGWNVASMTYELDRRFAASDRNVFEGAVTVRYALDTGERAWRYPIVTIITVEGGQVTEHRDYTDYAGMTEVTPARPANNQAAND